MCCEDELIAKASLGFARKIDTLQSAFLIAGANENRTCLIISGPTAGRLVVSMVPPTANNDGIYLDNVSPALVLSNGTHGNLVKQAWYGFSQNVSTCHVFESTLNGYCDGQ